MSAALVVRNLRKRFGGVAAVDDVSFTVDDGALLALIGPNGAGKSTLFNLLTNLYVPDAGTTAFFGRDLAGLAPHRIARLGLVRTFQSARVYPGMTVVENVLAGAHLTVRRAAPAQALMTGAVRREEHSLRARAAAILDVLGLSARAGDEASSLPLGAQKLLDVGRALMAQPRMLLLDEPAAGLNDGETDELARLIAAVRAAGTTVVVVEHNMSLVMGIADEVLVLDAGRLIARGTPDAVRADPRVVEAYIGREAEPAAP